MISDTYRAQADLLLQVLPHVAKKFLITNKAQLSVHALEVLISRDAINPSMGASLQPSGLQRPMR